MAPMGSGKKVLQDAVRNAYPEVVFLVSCTTRSPRPGEVDGREYHFISRDSFEKKVADGEFIEWAEFGGNLYGTLKSEILTPLSSGSVIVNEIEIQGVEQLIPLIPKEHRTIVYIDAGGWEVLRDRALARAPMSEAELILRHERYLIESKYQSHADVVIQNYDGKLAEAQQEFVDLVKTIIQKQSLTQ